MTTEKINHARWTVPVDGFEWITRVRKGEGKKEVKKFYLVPKKGPGREMAYNPLIDHSALYREFIDLKTDRDAVLNFANQYGWLGEPERLSPIKKPGKLLVVESSHLWATERRAMRDAVILYDNAMHYPKLLKESIKWADKDSVAYTSPTSEHWITTPKINPEILKQLKIGELKKPALFHVQSIINKHIEGRVSPRLLWNDDYSELRSYLVPSSLIGCLWLQFFISIDQRKAFKRCQVCGAWFEVHSSQRGQPRKTCSDKCRQKASRQRQSKRTKK